jgi:hypothetical protein
MRGKSKQSLQLPATTVRSQENFSCRVLCREYGARNRLIENQQETLRTRLALLIGMTDSIDSRKKEE